jgi:DNA modification methylase
VQPVFEHSRGVLYCGDSLAVLRELPEASVHCCVTSPPYWGLRDYGTAQWEGGDPACDHKREMNWPDPKNPNANSANGHGAASQKLGGDCAKCGARRIDQQLGLERTPEEYISRMAEVFREVRRVLRDDGTLWLNIGDSYASQGAAHGGREDNQSGVGAKRTHAAGAGDQNPRMAPADLKPKDLVGVPWMLAFALRADGWYLRSEIIWAKPNPMPESVIDRPTKAHEQIFLLAKSMSYFYDVDAIREPATLDRDPEDRTPAFWHHGTRNHADPRYQRTNGKHNATDPQAPGRRMVENVARKRAEGAAHDSPFGHTRNKRSVWTVATEAFPEAHFATFPQALIQPCILAGCPEGGTVLDPFSGAGTTSLVAKENGRRFIGIELNPDYCKMAAKRLAQEVLDLETA